MEVYDWERLKAAVQAGQHFEYVMFWGHTPPRDGGVNQACFSQWWPSEFVLDGKTYSCAEQYMMAEKARLFGDTETEAAIMLATDPKEMKQLGRAVSPFDPAEWERRSYDIVKRATQAKFEQNDALREVLMATRDTVLVEASPVDTIWGIGLAQDHPDARDPLRWRGRNGLGFALMEVRDSLA